ncbi:hypothetical protein Pla175_36060 [Pirellulimonas nuda]|uniref:CsbD-like domain-containing protein n=1 Tax=Pirellulimonas nuda TaxID=2528009 RepID=A0A518DFF1_9BACT|nr:CsbD family protein [Pirellulimonas nuda]QDU90204.1 hypothetical protein Pla175_36060 [Pirellulimonas nuda]
MNWDTIQGNWRQYKGEAQKKWGKLTGDDWDVVAGEKEKLLGKVQEHYGVARDEAEAQVKEFEKSCNC